MHKHNYHFFSQITNPNKIIEAKVKLFFDCLSIAFKFTNQHYDFPCENHKTVIKSIYYQLKYNNSKYAKSHISFYLDLLGTEFDQYKIFNYNTECLSSLRNYINKLEAQEKPNFSLFIEQFELLLSQLEETYFRNCLEKVINHVASNDELDSYPDNHSLIECIFMYTKYLAVEFYLTGASIADITSIVSIICNNSKDNSDKISHLSEFVNDLDNYFKNRTLIEQLQEIELLYKFIKLNQTVTFFIQPHYKIINIDIDFFGIKISSTKPKHIDEDWFNIQYNKFHLGTPIIDKNTLFAIVKINSNHSNTINAAREKLQLALNTLSKFTNNEYVISFAYELSKKGPSFQLTTEIEMNNEEFHNTIYEKFKHNKSIVNKRFDDFLTTKDFIFITGCHSKKRTDLLINLWFYIEAFFLDSEKAISQTSWALSKRIKEEFEKSLNSLIEINYYISFNKNQPYIIEKDKININKSINADIPTKLSFFKKKFKHPIITKKLIKFDNNFENTKFQDFIRQYLKQVNINRNLIVHNLIENDYFTGANLNLLLVVANYFRQDLISKTLIPQIEKK